MMTTRLPPSFSLYVVGMLLTIAGSCLILAPFLLAPLREALLLSWGAGALMLAAGIGLRRSQSWGWYLALAIAVTGLVALLWRLETGAGESWYSLAGALITDLVMVVVLLRSRPETRVPGRV